MLLGLSLATGAVAATSTVSSFAWFSMNTVVSATDMKVKAKAEGGIVIAAYNKTKSSTTYSETTNPGTVTAAKFDAPVDTAFTNVATIQETATELYPTSTASGLANWYHASSLAVNDYTAKSDSYETLGTKYDFQADGIAYDKTTKALQGQYYLLNKFKIKATDESTYSLYMTGITVSKTSPTSTTGSEALNKALRIAIKVDSNTYFFAPNYTSGTLYYYDGSKRASWTTNAINFGTTPNTTISTAVTSSGIDVEAYLYYEGEDENCKSINAVNIDTLTVNLTFSSTEPNA